MLQVTNGVVTLMVTKGAFGSFYKHKGFHIIDDEDGHEDGGAGNYHPTSETMPLNDSSQQEMTEDTEDLGDEKGGDEYDPEDDVDLSEIPLSEMSFDQLNDYADQLGLDHESIRSKKELRMLIRKHLKK